MEGSSRDGGGSRNPNRDDGFVCTPRHATYRNVEEHGAFTVSFPRPSEVVTTSLTGFPLPAGFKA